MNNINILLLNKSFLLKFFLIIIYYVIGFI